MPFDSNPGTLARLQLFATTHHTSLISAAELLGGAAGGRRCARLLGELSNACAMSRRLRSELDWLHGLLTLERVHDFGGEEAACFALIDPTDPRVDEVCLLSEVLGEQLEALPAPRSTASRTAVYNLAR